MQEIKIPRRLEVYLLSQLANPLPAVFCDSPRTGEVRKGFSYGGVQYRGSEDLIDYKDGKVTLHVQRQHLNMESDTITAPSSKMKQWRAKGMVTVHGHDFETGVYDVYDFGDGIRGYEPWPSNVPETPYSSKLPVTEFDNLWVPVAGLPNGRGPFSYFKFWQYQLVPIKGLPAPWGYSGPMIDLPAALQK